MYHHYTPISQLNSNYLHPNLPVRESQVIQGVHFERDPIISQQIHYVRLPVRFPTYSASPSTSQTRPLAAQHNQIQSQVFQHIQRPTSTTHSIPHPTHPPIVKRHKIFGEHRRGEDFTPRRRIYVQSKQHTATMFEEEKVVQKEKESSRKPQQNQSEQNKSELDKSFAVEDKEENIKIWKQSQPQSVDCDNTYEQIKQSLAEFGQKPFRMVDNKSTKSYNAPLNNQQKQQSNVDQLMSVQLNEIKRSFGKNIQESPVAIQPFPIPLYEEQVSESPFNNNENPIARQLEFSEIKPVLQQRTVVVVQQRTVISKPYYFDKVLLAITFLHFLFQLVR